MTAAVWTLIGLLFVSQGVLVTTLLQLRTELKEEIRDLRTELKAEIGDLRTELKAEIGDLRTELGDLRTETRRGFATLSGRLEAHIDRHAS